MLVRGCRSLLVLVLVTVALTAGCSSAASGPVTLPALTSTPTSSSSPSPSATATADELAAVTAVVRRYFELVNGPTTADAADQLLAMMTPACKCRRVATSMRDAALRHQHYFGTATITDATPNLDGIGAADVLVHYDYTAGGLRDANGRTLRAGSARKNVALDFRLTVRSGQWVISDVQIVAKGSPA